MQFMTAFMSSASRFWECVATCAGTVATFENHWPFDKNPWPLLL